MLQSLRYLSKVISGFSSLPPEIAPDKCSPLWHKRSKCSRCVDNCPRQAIDILQTVKIEKELCAGCGICGALCPNGVFKFSRFSYHLIIDAVKSRLEDPADQTVIYGCAGQSSADGALNVTCLGGLSEAALLLPFVFGAKSVRLDTGPCSGCEISAGLTVMEKNVSSANELLALMGRRERITAQAEDDLAAISGNGQEISPSFVRRDFFRQLQAKTVNTIYDVAQLTNEEPEISRAKIEVPEKTRLLLSVLSALGQPSDEKTAAENVPFRKLRISDKCGGCGYCAFFCPTQALRVERDDNRFELKFNPTDCTGCDLCVDICAEDAISREKWIVLKEALSDESNTIFCLGTAGRPAGGRETAWSDLLTYLYH